MNRMHIAHFTNTYYPVTSGVVRSVSSFRRALVELGHNVFIFAQHASDYKDKEPFVFRYPALELPLQEYPLTIPISNFINTLLPPLKLDVIHAHHPVLLGQAAARKAEDLNLPLVFTHHTRYKEYSHYVTLPQDLVKDVIERWLGDYMARCHHVVVPSESTRQLLAQAYGITERVTVVPTGIDLAPYGIEPDAELRRQRGWTDKTVLISVGRLAEEKNWRTLLAAMPTVVQQQPDAHLAILGGGDARRNLEAYSRELGVGEHVEFVGTVPYDEVPRYLKTADLFTFASVSETQGIVTLEALAAGLPVVAVDGSGTADVIEDGVDGLLTPNDSDALAQGILRVLTDETLRQKLRAATQEKVRQFDARHQAEKLVQVYEQAMEDKRRDAKIHVDKQKPIFKFDWRELFGRS